MVTVQRVIVDGFGGPGGWSEGARSLGLHDVGIEIGSLACATRRAAGHLTIRADMTKYPAAVFRGAWGAIFSPPCPDYSAAGLRAGRDGSSGRLVDLVPEWVRVIEPGWIACEQTPLAIDIFEEFGHLFRSWGYDAWVGILDAADYGVPQNRKRAFVLAARWPVTPPEPTHARDPHPGLFGTLEPWRTMYDALGWEPDGHRWVVDRRTNSKDGRGGMYPTVTVPLDRPSPTLTGKALGQWRIHKDTEPDSWVKLSVPDALAIQGFRRDYPVQGNKGEAGQQIGDAVPPPLAAHALSAVTGCALEKAA